MEGMELCRRKNRAVSILLSLMIPRDTYWEWNDLIHYSHAAGLEWLPDHICYLLLNLNCPYTYTTYIDNIDLVTKSKQIHILDWDGTEYSLEQICLFSIKCFCFCNSFVVSEAKSTSSWNHRQSWPHEGNWTDAGESLATRDKQVSSSSVPSYSRFLEPLFWQISWTSHLLWLLPPTIPFLAFIRGSPASLFPQTFSFSSGSSAVFFPGVCNTSWLLWPWLCSRLAD